VKQSLDKGEEVPAALTRQLMFALQKAEKENDLLTQSGKKKGPVSEEQKHQIYTTIRTVAWRTTKFVVNKKDSLFLAGQVYDSLVYDDGVEETQRPVVKAAWADDFCELIVTQLNGVRSYIIGRMREEAIKLLDQIAHDNDTQEPELPSFEDMKAAITRDFDTTVTDEKNKVRQDLFVWYADNFLRMAAGDPNDWGPHKRFFSTISVSHLPGRPNAQHIPASTEAFCLVVWEGYRRVWMTQWKLVSQDPKANIKPPRMKKDGRPLTTAEKALLSDCTDLDKGRVNFGGWKKAYVQKFQQYKVLIKGKRQEEASQTVEMWAMLKMRANAGVTHTTVEEWEKDKKKRKHDEVAVQDFVIDDLVGDEE